jgi:hypothetical protein
MKHIHQKVVISNSKYKRFHIQREDLAQDRCVHSLDSLTVGPTTWYTRPELQEAEGFG